MSAQHVLVDLGSTFTKVRVVTADGELVAAAQHRTTVAEDVFVGLDAALAAAGVAGDQEILACSSAGGGLQVGVVGLIDELTAEAGRQAALSAGARVERVVGNGLKDVGHARMLLRDRIDIVLLVGGTDGGDRATLLRSAEALAAAEPTIPVVVAGNIEAQDEALALLAGHHVVAAPNVMPAIGQLETAGVRAVIRELFISHVIGGKLPGSAERLRSLVQMATPDAVLRGVELLEEELTLAGLHGGVVVIDVGGATTDVHSANPPVDHHGYTGMSLPQTRAARTVEGDIGMRWTATGVVAAGREAGMIAESEFAELETSAVRRSADPGLLPAGAGDRATDRRLAEIAAAVALRRHVGTRRIGLTPEGAVIRHEGRDLTRVRCLIGTGGVFRGLDPEVLRTAHQLALGGRSDLLLSDALAATIDDDYVLAAAGLLRAVDPSAARAMLRARIVDRVASEATTSTGA